MLRALLALLIIVCPAASGEQQQISIPCNSDGVCLVHITVMKALIDQAQKCPKPKLPTKKKVNT